MKKAGNFLEGVGDAFVDVGLTMGMGETTFDVFSPPL